MANLVLGIDARQARQGAQEFDRATGRVTQSARQATTATNRVEGSFQRLRPAIQAASGAFAAFGGALAIRQFIRFADTATELESRLRLVTDTSEELASIQRDIFELSQETRTSLEGTTTLYTRLSQALEGTGVAQERVFQVTEAVNKALQLSGATTAEASSAVVQFSQAIAGSTVRAEEFNSLIDASPRLIRALINELEGVKDVGALRQLLEEGELTRERVIEALTNALPRLRGEFENLDRTTSQAFTQLNNALLQAISNINEQSGATNALNDAIDSIREVVSDQQFQQDIVNLASNLVTISNLSLGNLPEIVRLYERLANSLSFLGDFGLSPTGLPSLDLSDLAGGSGGSSQEQAGTRITIPPGSSQPPAPSTKPSLFDVPAQKPFEEGEDLREAQRQAAEEAQRAFARSEIDRVNRVSDTIRQQREELDRLGQSLRDDINPAWTQYRDRIENLNTALEAGRINQREFNQLAQQAGESLNDQAQKGTEGLRNMQQAADQLGFSFSSAFEDAIVKGEKFSSVLQGLAQDILRILVRTQITQPAAGALSDVFGSVFGNILGGGGGAATGAAVPTSAGGLGQPLPTFAEGGVTSGPSIAGERGREAIVPLPDGRTIPARVEGGSTEVNIYNSGGEQPEVRRSRNGNGGERIDVIFDREAKRAVASGKLDKPMRDRFGITPQTRG